MLYMYMNQKETKFHNYTVRAERLINFAHKLKNNLKNSHLLSTKQLVSLFSLACS